MVQTGIIYLGKIAPVENPVFSGLHNHFKVQPELVNGGFFHIFSPLDYIEAIQDKGESKVWNR